MACLEIWNTSNKNNQINIDEINSAPENIIKILKMVDREVFEMLKYHISYFGNLREYEGDWIRRSDGVKIKKRFYDEREWRSLKVTKNQLNLKFKGNDITILLVNTQEEKQELICILNAISQNLEIESIDIFSKKIKLFKDVMNEIDICKQNGAL